MVESIKVARVLASSPLVHKLSFCKVQGYHSCNRVRLVNTTHFKRKSSTQNQNFKVVKTSSVQQNLINKTFSLTQALTAKLMPHTTFFQRHRFLLSAINNLTACLSQGSILISQCYGATSNPKKYQLTASSSNTMHVVIFKWVQFWNIAKIQPL